jgi:hypothetical protein
MRAFGKAFAKAVDNLLIFALQMAIKHLALSVSFSVESGFKTALLVAAKRYRQLLDTNMKFIPRHLISEKYTFYSQKSVANLKAELQSLFDNKWYDFSTNLTGDFTADNEFNVTKKVSLSFSKSGSSGSTKLKCKIYPNADKAFIEIIVKPNPQLYVWTIIPPLLASWMLYSVMLHSANDLTAAIIIIAFLFIIPITVRFYGQALKTELKNTFVDAFKLTKA